MMNDNPNRQPVPISTIDVDVDEIDISPRMEPRRPYTYDETFSSSSENKKTRWCLVTLILILIIVCLLSIASVIIAIYSLVLSTTRAETIATTPATTSTTASATSTGLICTSSPTTSYIYSNTAPFQCLNYTNNSDITRNIAYTQSINICDNVSPFRNTTSIWIRFLDPAGKIIPNAPSSPNRCGGVATGWYAGRYPIAAFTTATSIVCFFISTNTCDDCSLISVTNCETFYVFLLPMPNSCNYRYCTL